MEGVGHPPLLMLDPRCVCLPSQDGEIGCPKGMAGTTLCEWEGQSKVQMLFERADAVSMTAVSMSSPQKFTTCTPCREMSWKKSKSQKLKSGEEKDTKIIKMRPVD